MAQTQFTPAQILDAARRAEAEGHHEYAQQAFRHLIDVFPTSPEAAVAQDTLARRQTNAATALDRLQHSLNNGAAAPASNQQFAGQQPQARQRVATSTDANYADPNAARQRAGNLKLEPVAGAEHADRQAGIPEPRRRNHPIGRFLAVLMLIFGTLLVAFGLLVIAAVVAAPQVINQVAAGAPIWIGAGIGAGFVIAGLSFVLFSLAARAAFENARMLYWLALAEHKRTNRR